ncbi:hypothetical protein, conserved [Eimeria praecox]|uniref:Uncharacterized protein n=1 Tax=Eimeria praecox TaxID=51316 RepID=U6G254_9EIME|nr:hypothetical protein, conserved [Eimeria praecox]
MGERAAQNPTAVCGSSFWASQRDEVMRSLREGELSLSTAALLMVAFSRAGELTGPLATAVAERLCTAFRAATRGGATRLLLEEGEPPLERALTMKTSETDFRVHFSDGATVLFAMKEGGLLQDPCAGAAARELQEELLLCVQPQWGSLTFTQLRRVFLLLGATSEPLGLSITVALELLNAVKKRLRKMQKMTRRLFEGGDARDTVAVLLAYISPFDLALGFAGLQRLGQQNCAEYVLAAFSAAAAAASCEELCRLGRDILLAGARQKALWEAFADAVQTAAEERLQTEPGKQRSPRPGHPVGRGSAEGPVGSFR